MRRLHPILRHTTLVAALTLVGIFAAALLLTPPDSLAVDPKRDLPFYEMPFGSNPFAPGEIQTPDRKMVDWRGVPSARDCGVCHRQEFIEWRTSMHAISDEDLIYASTVRRNTGKAKAAAAHGDAKGRWCESCHNPLGSLAGAVNTANSVQLTETMEEGVSCIVCHTASHSEPLAGNGALTVRMNDIFRHLHLALIMAAPSRHARDMQPKRDVPLMGSSALCGACHTEIRPTVVNGHEPMNFQETYDEWRRSPWAERGVQCQDCHMARDPAATVAALKRGERPPRGVSHRIAGNNYLLANPDLPGGLMTSLRGGVPGGQNLLFTQDEYVAEQRRTRDQAIALLKEAAEVSVAPDVAGRQLAVTVANRGAGHALPTGPLDQRYMWLEIDVADASGRSHFHVGAFDEKKGSEDANAPRWVKILTDDEGQRDLRHMLFDSAKLEYRRKPIVAGGSDTIDIALPELPTGDYRISVKLWYRLAFQEILANIAEQRRGKVDVVIPPLLIAQTDGELRVPVRAAPLAKERP
jgi:hypothetical protein